MRNKQSLPSKTLHEDFWGNITLSASQHAGVLATYAIHNVRANKFFVGVCMNVHHGMSVMAGRLKNGTFPHVVFQQLAQPGDVFDLVLLVPDARLPQSERETLARETARTWKRQYGVLCVNYDPGRLRGGCRGSAEVGGPTVDELIPVRRKAQDFKIPARDFLHRAWYGEGA